MVPNDLEALSGSVQSSDAMEVDGTFRLTSNPTGCDGILVDGVSLQLFLSYGQL